MITSSSKRIIKRPDASGLIEQYIPPRELSLSREPKMRRAAFPHYSSEGEEKGEYFLGKEEDLKDFNMIRPSGENHSSPEEIYAEEALRKQWKEEARKALEEAREEAGRLLEEARAEAQKEFQAAREEGYQKGLEDGYRDGKARGEAECREAFRADIQAFETDIRKAIQSVETAKENCIRRYMDQLKDCAIAIGEKVIHISLRSSGEVIKQMIVSATEKLKKTAWVKIYIDKCDYDMMMEADADILDELSHLSDNIKFIVMDKEERGNCIIEMPEEIVDVSVNTQIENIKDILENVRI